LWSAVDITDAKPVQISELVHTGPQFIGIKWLAERNALHVSGSASVERPLGINPLMKGGYNGRTTFETNTRLALNRSDGDIILDDDHGLWDLAYRRLGDRRGSVSLQLGTGAFTPPEGTTRLYPGSADPQTIAILQAAG
jgi:hypothetical protein